MQRLPFSYVDSQKLAPLFYCLTISILLTTRDLRFVSLIRGDGPEGSDVVSGCTDFPRCFRYIPSLFLEITSATIVLTSKFLAINPDPFSSTPITLPERNTMAVILSGLILRFGCFLIVWKLLERLFLSSRALNLIFSSFLIILIAPWAKFIGIFSTHFISDDRVTNWIARSPVVYTVYYDYFLPPIILYLTINLHNFLKKNPKTLLLIGLILFITFEFLPLFLFFALLIHSGRKFARKFFLLLIPGMVLLVFALLVPKDSTALNLTFGYYLGRNFDQFLAVIPLMALVLLPCIVLGYFSKKIMQKEYKQLSKTLSHSTNKNFESAFFSLCAVHFFSLFTSNFLGEFSRHALATQLILLILFFLRRKS